MSPTCTFFVCFLTSALFFASLVSASAQKEILFYDYDLMASPLFFFNTAARGGTTTFNALDSLPIEIEGKITRGMVRKGTVITGKIRLAATDSDAADRQLSDFTVTLKKNGAAIGSQIISVQEAADPLYSTYPVSFPVSENIVSSDVLVCYIEASPTATVNEDRWMQIDPNHSNLVFPLSFSWAMFLPAIVTP